VSAVLFSTRAVRVYGDAAVPLPLNVLVPLRRVIVKFDIVAVVGVAVGVVVGVNVGVAGIILEVGVLVIVVVGVGVDIKTGSGN